MRFVKQAICALVPLAALTGAALAQDDRFPNLFNIITGSVPQQQTQSDQWSGQPGASGHPLMQPDQILAAVADFKNCLERMWPDAARRGISRASFDTHTARLEPDIKIMDLRRRAAGVHARVLGISRFARHRRAPCQRPRGSRPACERVRGGRAHLWGRSSCDRGDLGHRDQIRRGAGRSPGGPLDRDARLRRAAAGLLQGRVSRDTGNPASRRHPPGAAERLMAGAFGLTQFMPTAFKRYAIDFDGDGRRDVVGSVPDVIASTATSGQGRMGLGADLGLRGRAAAGLQLSAGRSCAPPDARRMGAARRAARERRALSAADLLHGRAAQRPLAEPVRRNRSPCRTPAARASAPSCLRLLP